MACGWEECTNADTISKVPHVLDQSPVAAGVIVRIKTRGRIKNHPVSQQRAGGYDRKECNWSKSRSIILEIAVRRDDINGNEAIHESSPALSSESRRRSSLSKSQWTNANIGDKEMDVEKYATPAAKRGAQVHHCHSHGSSLREIVPRDEGSIEDSPGRKVYGLRSQETRIIV